LARFFPIRWTSLLWCSKYVAGQLAVDDLAGLERYLERRPTRFDHAAEIKAACGLREFAEIDVAFSQDQGQRPDITIADTGSYSDVVFGLCYLLGREYRPRWRKCPTRRLLVPAAGARRHAARAARPGRRSWRGGGLSPSTNFALPCERESATPKFCHRSIAQERVVVLVYCRIPRLQHCSGR
jgi:Tn3 transposase DDE domain/Domain of unknown function (DUF4158)